MSLRAAFPWAGSTTSPSTDVVRRVTEVLDVGESGGIPIWRHPEWQSAMPWLFQGTTGRSGEGTISDFGLFGEVPVRSAIDRWKALRQRTGMHASVHSRQVHGAQIADWTGMVPAGLVVTEGADGHATQTRGVLLTVSVADCVPVFIVSRETRSVALVHAGWRGIAAGIVEAAIKRLGRECGAAAEGLLVHCGPAICGGCYEVGPEVHQALRPGSEVRDHRPVDLAEAITERAERAGVPGRSVTASTHCVHCGPAPFYSHRGGASGRQLGLLGLV